MPVDFLPRDALPGHLQGWSLSFGTLPLTHTFTFHDTGPHVSISETVLPALASCGRPTPYAMPVGTCSRQSAESHVSGYSVPSAHGSHP